MLKTYWIASVALALLGAPAQGGTIGTTWTLGSGATSATGTLGSVTISATGSNTAGFLNNVPFVIGDGNSLRTSAFSTPYPLGFNAVAMTGMNGGDFTQFNFSSTVSDLFLYVENLDSFSRVDVTVTGLTGTPTMLSTDGNLLPLAILSTTQFQLVSTTGSTLGEGDALIRLQGAITQIRFDFTDGRFDNGVTYSFAIDQPNGNVVPEPGTAALFLLGLLTANLARRKRSRKC